MHLKRLLVAGTLALVNTVAATLSTTLEDVTASHDAIVNRPIGPGSNATIQNDNPPATYMAVLPTANFNNATNSTADIDSIAISGSITGMANSNGTGVFFYIDFDFTGLASDHISKYSPFSYHIHASPVSSDGNCTSTLSYLDPTNRGESHPCEEMRPETCQAGDLAGKHGDIITSTRFVASYLELYLSTSPGSEYFFGDKSLVVSSGDRRWSSCANFKRIA